LSEDTDRVLIDKYTAKLRPRLHPKHEKKRAMASPKCAFAGRIAILVREPAFLETMRRVSIGRDHKITSTAHAISLPNSRQEMPLHLSIPRLRPPGKYLEFDTRSHHPYLRSRNKNRRQRTPEFGIFSANG
jgi:hypothetical protein